MELPLGFLPASFRFLLDMFGGRADQRFGLGEAVADGGEMFRSGRRSPASW